MSWIFVPESAACPSGFGLPLKMLAQSVTWRGKLFALKSWQGRWNKGGWIPHLFGRISPPSTAARGVESWISSLRDSRASRGAEPAKGSAKTTRDGSGTTSSESSKSASLEVSSLRTSTRKHSSSPSLTFQSWASTLVRPFKSLRQTWVRATDENGSSSLLPTPTASSYGSNRGGAAGRVGPVRYSLASMAKLGLLPTPTAGDSSPSGSKGYVTGHAGTTLSAVARPCGKGWLVSPRFSEWLMGFPPNWTTNCGPTETQWSRWLRQSHCAMHSIF